MIARGTGFRRATFLTACFILLAALPCSAQSGHSLDIVIWDDFVGARLSSDGSTVGFSRASAEAGAGVYDAETGQRTFFVSGRNSVSHPAPSADGSIIQFAADSPDQLFEINSGSTTIVPNRPYTPVALSDDGMIAVGFANGTAARVTGGVNGTVEDLGDLAGGSTSSVARGVSGDGEIVVGRGRTDIGNEGFRWEAGMMSGLGDLAGGVLESEALAISQDGETIVGFGTSAAGREAVRWDANGIASLGNMGGLILSSESNGVSSDGSVIGVSAILSGNDRAAMVWDSANGMRELAVVLEAAGVDLMTIDLRTVFGVSADGKTFIGGGYQDDFFPDPDSPFGVDGVGNLVWIATIPEPTTALLLGLGLVAMSARRSVRPCADAAGT